MLSSYGLYFTGLQTYPGIFNVTEFLGLPVTIFFTFSDAKLNSNLSPVKYTQFIKRINDVLKKEFMKTPNLAVVFQFWNILIEFYGLSVILFNDIFTFLRMFLAFGFA